MDRSHLLHAAALAAAVALAGCSSHKGTADAKAPRGSAGRPTDRFETTRKDPPIAIETRMAAGQLAQTNRNLPAAARQYREALKVDPKYSPAIYRLAVVYAEMKKFPEALDLWKRYLVATNHAAAAYSNLGFCYELMGNTKEAEEAYQKGVARDPNNVPCRVNYGLLLVRKGRIGEGRVQLSAVLQPAEVHYNVGSVYEATGRKEQAKAEYREALQLDPQFADAVTRLNELECGPAPAPSRAPSPAPVPSTAQAPATAATQPVQTEPIKQASTEAEPVTTD